MTPLALVAMRKAASLAFAVPGLEVDIDYGGETIARVERRFDGSVVHVFATTVAHDVVVATLRGGTLPSLGEFHDVPGDVFVSASLDPVAAVTLVYCEARLASLPIARAVIERVMEAAQVHFGVAEITTEIEHVRL